MHYLHLKRVYMLTVSIKQIPLASFALSVNNVAIISSITVRNNTPNNYEGLKVRITFDPEFADTVVEHIVSLPAHESWKKPNIQPSINTSYLCNLTEKTKATTTDNSQSFFTTLRTLREIFLSVYESFIFLSREIIC